MRFLEDEVGKIHWFIGSFVQSFQWFNDSLITEELDRWLIGSLIRSSTDSLTPLIQWLIDSLNHIEPLVHWIVDSLIHFFSDPLIHWTVGPLIHWFVDSLVRWFVGSLIRWFMCSSIQWFTDSLLHWIIDDSLMILWIFESLTRWPIDPLKRSVIGSLVHWFVDSQIHWIIESLNHCFIDLHGLGTNYLVDNLIDGASLNICCLVEKNLNPSMRRVQRPCLPNRFQGKSIPKITTLFCRMKEGDPVEWRRGILYVPQLVFLNFLMPKNRHIEGVFSWFVYYVRTSDQTTA